MKFTLKNIQSLVKEADEPTGVPFLDSRYDWYTQLVGHPNPYYRLFYLIAQEFKPEFVVELGSYRATGAAHFAMGNSQAQVVTVDWHRDASQVDDKAMCIRTCNGLDNLDYINKASWDAIEDVKAYQKPIDILFIDAWHTEEYVKLEQKLYFPLLNKPALVICDDIFENAGQFPGMVKWFESLPGEKFLNDEVHPGVPMGFLKYEPKPTRTTRKK
jgi:predicted O-methyltransferase YrrM